jgi:hypothetical protein
MSAGHAPAVLLSQSLDEFLGQIPSIRDGSEDGVHRSRVAIRRMRESLALARDEYDPAALADVKNGWPPGSARWDARAMPMLRKHWSSGWKVASRSRPR